MGMLHLVFYMYTQLAKTPRPLNRWYVQSSKFKVVRMRKENTWPECWAYIDNCAGWSEKRTEKLLNHCHPVATLACKWYE